MDDAVLHFNVRGGISEEDAFVWLRRRNVEVAKIRTALFVKRDPDFKALDL
jgi:hypothetical protein